MPASINEIVSRMRQALSLSEPDLDTSIGTPVRKILDAVAEVVAEASLDTYLLDYQYDIESRVGPDLDDFVGLFGFARLPAKRATGSVVFERNADATNNVLIPIGTQVATDDAKPIVAQTMVAAMLLVGETSVAVPVQAVIGGASGNVAATALRRRITPLRGVSSFANPTALTGGADGESDDQLRDRFKRTVFRNLAGTEQMFLGVAMDDESVTHANVIGATKRHREQIQIVGGTATSTIVNDKYTYPNSSFFGRDIDAGDHFVPGVDYNFSDAEPPVVTVLDPTKVPDGIYDLQYEYLPLASRNDPTNGITNRIDIYLNGERPTAAAATIVFRRNRTFNTTPGDQLHRDNFRRQDEAKPLSGNYFIAYPFAPVMDPSINDQIEIGGETYLEGVDYWLVNDVTNLGGTPTSLSGIEFAAVPSGGKVVPPDPTLFSVDFIYNAVPRDVDQAIRVWRLITTDVAVHEAKKVRMQFHLAVMYSPGYNEGVVRPEVERALAVHLSRVGFNGVVQVSDILEVVHRVPGIDAVRMLTSTDNPTYYAIQQVAASFSTALNGDQTLPRSTLEVESTDGFPISGVLVVGNQLVTYGGRTSTSFTSCTGGVGLAEDGTRVSLSVVVQTYQTGGRARDILVGDDELPVFDAVTLTPKAQNTFGQV